MKTVKRLDIFDVLKGIAILLMIVGHSNTEPEREPIYKLTVFIYSFHMPLFFVISGYFFKKKENVSVWQNSVKLFKRLIIPYAFTCLVMLGIIICQNIEAGIHYSLFQNWIVEALFASGSKGGTGLLHNTNIIGAIWFLLAMFWALVIYELLNVYKNRIPLILSVLIVSYLGYYTAKYIRLPFSIQSGMMCVVFVFIGNKVKEFNLLQTKRMIFIILPLLYLWYLSFSNGFLSTASCTMTHYPLELIGSLGGIYVFYLLSKLIDILRHLKYVKTGFVFLGKYTLVILCFHNLDIMLLNNYYQEYIADYTMFVLMIILRIVASVIVIYVVKRNDFLYNLFIK